MRCSVLLHLISKWNAQDQLQLGFWWRRVVWSSPKSLVLSFQLPSVWPWLYL